MQTVLASPRATVSRSRANLHEDVEFTAPALNRCDVLGIVEMELSLSFQRALKVDWMTHPETQETLQMNTCC